MSVHDYRATKRPAVAEIEAEAALVAANRELITRFEQKIQVTIARIWGEAAPTATGALSHGRNRRTRRRPAAGWRGDGGDGSGLNGGQRGIEGGLRR